MGGRESRSIQDHSGQGSAWWTGEKRIWNTYEHTPDERERAPVHARGPDTDRQRGEHTATTLR